MIPARKNALLDGFLHVYFRRLARRAFHTIAARGLEHLRTLPDDCPVLLFCNHTNWWDGLILYLLSRQIPRKAIYCMMEEKQLIHYRFFTWLGAFSVDLADPVRAGASLRYAARLLKKPDTALWIFPQGRLCHPGEPVEIRPGTDFLARHSPTALLVSVALRYEFFREDRPNVLIEIGTPFPAMEGTGERMAREANAVFARADQAARAQDIAGFVPLYPPRWPINKRWQWLKLAVLCKLKEFTLEN